MDAIAPETTETIFVDLDGTLIRSDLLWESLFMAARAAPVSLLSLPLWLSSGKARLKHELAMRSDFDPALLPYRTEVVEFLTEARARGRRVVLATGANQKLAHAVARHLGIFDAVMASDEAVNLTSQRKLDRIVEHCGVHGFDYVGNSHEDLCLLAAASEATVVAPDRAAARWQQASGATLIGHEGGTAKAALKAMRPHQWMKNLLIFVPLVLSLEFFNLAMLASAMLAFFAFSFAASAVYILNDLLDLKADRRHKTKCRRPFASGALSISTGVKMAAALLGAAVLMSLVLPVEFQLVLALYLAVTTAYSFALKRMLLIDVMTLAGLYTVRVFAGEAACDIAPSFWLLAFSIFFFLSLALVKRYTELQDFGAGADRATTGRGYVDADLETLSQAGMASGFASVLVLALYIDSMEIQQAYSSPMLVWFLCPLVLYIIVRIWVLARRQQMHDDPVVFILRDWRSQMMIGFGALMFMAAAYV